MTVSSANRIALFIDGANLHSTAKALGFGIEYERLLKDFRATECWCAHFTTSRSLKISSS